MKFDIQFFLSSQYAKWMIITLICLFSLLTISEFSRLFFPLIPQTPPSLSNNDLVGEVKKNAFDSIISASLCGVYVSNDLNGDNVKKSMLNVNLVGVLLGNTMDESQVIIQSANGEEQTYKIDDMIPGDAVIKKIMANGVLVERNGTLESLSLPKNDLTFEAVAKPLIGE